MSQSLHLHAELFGLYPVRVTHVNGYQQEPDTVYADVSLIGGMRCMVPTNRLLIAERDIRADLAYESRHYA